MKNKVSEIKEILWEMRADWLKGQGSDESAVLENEDGEYILEDFEGEGGVIESTAKNYLPEQLTGRGIEQLTSNLSKI